MIREKTRASWSLLGAIFAALAASSCCTVPLLLATLGLGGAAAFAGIAKYRPLLLGVAAVMLSTGFYLTYRRRRTTDACGCDEPRRRRLPAFVLWLATVVTVVLAASPPILAKLSRQPESPSPGPFATAVVRVEGIDCEACAIPIKRALSAAGGFDHLQLDVAAQTVTIFYQPGPNRPEAYLRALETLGYEARVEDLRGTSPR
jgi:copper chaperone CopZ